MFLFLSKFLALLIYPLGLTVLLLLGAIVLLWWRPRLAALPIVLALVVLLGASSGAVCEGIVRSLEFQNLPPADLPQADAIVVLGGCTQAADPPRPWVDLMEGGDRVVHAARLFKAGKAPKVILSGGRVGWRGETGSESEDMAQLVEFMGVPRSAILQDPTSLNTRENAVNVKQIMEQQKIQRILLITSATHMPRSLLIFKRLGIDAIPAPTDFVLTLPTDRQTSSPEATLLELLPDVDRLSKTTRALKEYVGIWVYRLRGWA
ncbi:MAG TPA: YdcF family protein [Thermosynechococcaceae cyanobacterium]